jgi:lipopolysaccharide transport system ATP-binding protein
MKPIISVQNLSKRYKLGVFNAKTLREEAEAFLSRFSRKKGEGIRQKGEGAGSTLSSLHSPSAQSADFWALRDVSFDVQPGEVIGVIGRNGAGKSTLLKILSRITEPTSGEARIRGRVASLLEVGTGFHPELTGRENVFLNGAILGMTKQEIRNKFDEIVAFAEIEKFIDTPVKRYSSGMYVRLAFAVAAHLEPEILIVDEVLAVGDVEFQRKCLGKMKEVSGQDGRTVLFVSHNLHAVSRLCSRGCYLRDGQIVEVGDISKVLASYEKSFSSGPQGVARGNLFENAKLRIQQVDPAGPSGEATSAKTGEPFRFLIRGYAKQNCEFSSVGIVVYHATGAKLLNLDSLRLGKSIQIRRSADFVIAIDLDSMPLLSGEYFFSLWMREKTMTAGIEIEKIGKLEVVEKARSIHEIKPGGDGAVLCPFQISVT